MKVSLFPSFFQKSLRKSLQHAASEQDRPRRRQGFPPSHLDSEQKNIGRHNSTAIALKGSNYFTITCEHRIYCANEFLFPTKVSPGTCSSVSLQVRQDLFLKEK